MVVQVAGSVLRFLLQAVHMHKLAHVLHWALHLLLHLSQVYSSQLVATVGGRKIQGMLDSCKSRHTLRCLQSRNPAASWVESFSHRKEKKGGRVYHFDTLEEA